MLEENDPDAVFVNLLENQSDLPAMWGKILSLCGIPFMLNGSCDRTQSTAAIQLTRRFNLNHSGRGAPGRSRIDGEAGLLSNCVWTSLLHSTHIAIDFLDIKTDNWVKNFELFHDRVGSHPERIKNMFFCVHGHLRVLTKLEDLF